MSFLRIQNNNTYSCTPINNIFIDNYLPKANGTLVKIYIYIYRLLYNQETEWTLKEIAVKLDILESDIILALKYWQKEGLLDLIHEEENDLFEITYVFPSQSNGAVNNKGTDIPQINNNYEKKSNISQQKIILDSRPQYSQKEIELYVNNSEEVKILFKTAQTYLGKMLSFSDLSILFSFYDWLHLPINVIEFLIKYCSSNNHTNIRYIEKVAIEWSEKGIDSLDKAEAHIKMFNLNYHSIMKIFGLSRRDPTPIEIEYMDKWFITYKLPLEVILDACKKTVLQTSQPNFKYTHKILTEWYESKVRNLDDVKKLEDAHIAKKQQEQQSKSAHYDNNKKTFVRPNKFINFEQPTWDYDQLEVLEREYIQKQLEQNKNN